MTRIRTSRSKEDTRDGRTWARLTRCVILTPSQYTAAVKTSSLEPTGAALSKLGGLLTKDPKLVTILEAPTLSAADKSQVVAELEKQAGAGGETVKNLLRTLADNNRLSLLGGVCSKFDELISASRGEVEMTITSAQVCGNDGDAWGARFTRIII